MLTRVWSGYRYFVLPNYAPFHIPSRFTTRAAKLPTTSAPQLQQTVNQQLPTIVAYSPSVFALPSLPEPQSNNSNMSSADAQIVYNRHGSSGSSESVEAQDSFAQQFDLANPEEAMSSYQKYASLLCHPYTFERMLIRSLPGLCTNTPCNNSSPPLLCQGDDQRRMHRSSRRTVMDLSARRRRNVALPNPYMQPASC